MVSRQVKERCAMVMIRALRKENLKPRMTVLGYISTGIIEKTFSERQGREVTHPKQVDYFVLPEELKAWFESQGQTGTPKVLLDVYFPSDDIEKVFPVQYEYWIKGKKLCWGDDISGRATRIKIENHKLSEPYPVECKGAECPLQKEGKCSPHGKLHIIIPDYPEFGVFAIQTSGWSSCYSIMNCFYSNEELLGFGRFTGIPIRVEVRPFTATIDGRQTTRYKIVPKVNRSPREVMDLTHTVDTPAGALTGSAERTVTDSDFEPGPQVAEESSGAPAPAEEAEQAASGVVDGEFIEDEDPFAGIPDAQQGTTTILPSHAAQLEQMRGGVIPNDKWAAALKVVAGVEKSSDLPKQITLKGKVWDTFEYFTKAIQREMKGEKRPEAAPEPAPAPAPAKGQCQSCNKEFPLEELETNPDDNKLYCAACMDFTGSMAAAAGTDDPDGIFADE
jgi:hypothetical protein